HLMKIFISYRRDDSADVTGRIYDRLVERYGKIRIFKDVDSIPFGVDFRTYLDEAVGDCTVLIAVIGDKWLYALNPLGKRRLDDPGDFVRIEIASALKRNILVIPVLVNGAKMPAEGDLPDDLKGLVYRNGTPVRHDPDFHTDVDRVLKGLDKVEQK